VYQPRRIARPIARKLGQFAVVMGAASLAASFALLVLAGPSGAVTAATPSAAATAGCHPLSDEGTCYEPGEFCRTTDHGLSGVAGDGKAITCEDNDGWRWEPQAGAAASPTPDATTSAPTEAPTQGATTGAPVEAPTTGAPVGAPPTGGGTGPGVSGTLVAAGGAIMVVGAGLVFLSRRRGRRVPV